MVEPTAPEVTEPVVVTAPEVVAEVAPVVEPEIVAEPVKVETVLGAEIKPEPEVKAEPQPLVEPVKAEEAKPAYEAFILPEGVQADPEAVKEFASMLGSFESISKSDHAETQKFGQAMLDYHVGRVQDAMGQLEKAYQDNWKKQTEDWRKSFESDPEIGGNRRDTTVSAANDFIRTHGGSAEQQKEFRELMEKTGIGNHPAMIRMLANAGLSRDHAEGKPLPAQAPAQAKQSKIAKMYKR